MSVDQVCGVLAIGIAESCSYLDTFTREGICQPSIISDKPYDKKNKN